jgi:Ala-tRNA(Pro) deacylase
MTTLSPTAKERLEEYLRQNSVSFILQHHPTAYTAQAAADSEHVAGKQMAKPVVVIADGRRLMLVVPASYLVDISKLGPALHAREARLEEERAFASLFPDCELGALPPFGNLYGLPVYVDRSLAEDDFITFRAGTHTDTLRIPYAEFARLVQPQVIDIAQRRQLAAI